LINILIVGGGNVVSLEKLTSLKSSPDANVQMVVWCIGEEPLHFIKIYYKMIIDTSQKK
jgi:hypothetical protein